MLGVLVQAFGKNAVTSGHGVARQSNILLIDLRRITANPPTRPIAIVGLCPRRNVRTPARATPAAPLIVVRSHRPVFY